MSRGFRVFRDFRVLRLMDFRGLVWDLGVAGALGGLAPVGFMRGLGFRV